eukprot:scaffold271_cov112-Isochrysis_galbana.AAC.4
MAELQPSARRERGRCLRRLNSALRVRRRRQARRCGWPTAPACTASARTAGRPSPAWHQGGAARWRAVQTRLLNEPPPRSAPGWRPSCARSSSAEAAELARSDISPPVTAGVGWPDPCIPLETRCCCRQLPACTGLSSSPRPDSPCSPECAIGDRGPSCPAVARPATARSELCARGCASRMSATMLRVAWRSAREVTECDENPLALDLAELLPAGSPHRLAQGIHCTSANQSHCSQLVGSEDGDEEQSPIAVPDALITQAGDDSGAQPGLQLRHSSSNERGLSLASDFTEDSEDSHAPGSMVMPSRARAARGTSSLPWTSRSTREPRIIMALRLATAPRQARQFWRCGFWRPSRCGLSSHEEDIKIGTKHKA